MFATSLALIAQEFAPNERGTAFGLWGATTGFSVAVGPLVGGVLTEHLGWEWIFFVNVPVGLITAWMTFAQVRESEPDTSARIDWAGLVTFSGSLFCLVLALIEGNDKGWSSAPIVGLLAASVVLMAAFAAVELRSERPMLDLRLFRIPAFTGAQITAFVLHASMFSMFLYLVIYVQSVLGYSPLEAGRALPAGLRAVVPRRARGRQARRAAAGARLPGRRPGAGRLRPAADDGHRPGRRLDHAAARLHRRPASGSAAPTRRWPRPRSAWSSRGAAGPPRASTARSGRSGSPPGSPGWARSSRRA